MRRATVGNPEHAPPLRLGVGAKVVTGAVTISVLSMIYVPIVLIAVLSFQGPTGQIRLPLDDPGLRWYRALWDTRTLTLAPDYAGQPVTDFKPAILTSLLLALATVFIATTLAFAAAQAMRTRFRGSRIVMGVLLLGIVTPGVAVSLGTVTAAGELGVTTGPFVTGIGAHVVWTLPFCFLVFVIMFNRFDRSVEEAAYTLGASRLRAFATVTVPVMRPAILSSVLFAFTLSMDNFAHSVFIMGAQQTLPLSLVAAVALRITPQLFALGTLIMVASISLVLLYVWNLRRTLRRWERVGAAVPRLVGGKTSS